MVRSSTSSKNYFHELTVFGYEKENFFTPQTSTRKREYLRLRASWSKGEQVGRHDVIPNVEVEERAEPGGEATSTDQNNKMEQEQLSG